MVGAKVAVSVGHLFEMETCPRVVRAAELNQVAMNPVGHLEVDRRVEREGHASQIKGVVAATELEQPWPVTFDIDTPVSTVKQLLGL